MPPQTNVYVNAPQAAKAKGFMGFSKSKAEPAQGWSTIRTLGQVTRRAARRPVWE
ncbi:hypothetical protein [Caulobacter sp.]|uniref:hypothetical protein n=1 Tax=Caulobacter sp. TaxID=78 RepID=UPI002B471072|nr:hypothetical protein [Caulobacter sp.]HJV40574.1 hypothetical protein [Caulobacter sp.]